MFASKRSRSYVVCAALVSVPLLLSACGKDWGPGPMPTGYTYQGDVYKAAPGPRPGKFDDRLGTQDKDVVPYHPGGHGTMLGQSGHEAGIYVVSTWSIVAQDLIDRMLVELGKPMETVYVVPGDFPALEDALRQAMVNRTIPVSLRNGDGPFTLQYIVTRIPNSNAVSVTLMSVGSKVHEVNGVYTLEEQSSVHSIGHSMSEAVPAPVVHSEPVAAPMKIIPAVND